MSCKVRLLRSALICAVLLVASVAFASDHADPMDLLNRQRQEGAITDLFCFPILADETPAYPFTRDAKLPLHDTLVDIVRKPLTDEEKNQIDSLVFIMCMRRQLTDATMLRLEPYTYSIHIDLDSAVTFPTEADLKSEKNPKKYMNSQPHQHTHHGDDATLGVVEAFARYGGKIDKPATIREDITIEFHLNDDVSLRGPLVFKGTAASAWRTDARIRSVAGVFDDPFIFPAFYGTNVVAFAMRVPMDLFPKDKQDLLIWATSKKGRSPIDHVGRSLRTQNPRFELLNELHPSKHVRTLLNERDHPSLMRDIALRVNLGSYYAYREWDFVPDVMCYSTRFQVGFPNGRLLTDDVAAILAQHGDTLLYELSYQDPMGGWPRQPTNDRSANPGVPGVFNASFPYLLAPLPNRPQPPPRRLATANVVKLVAIALFTVSFFVFTHWAFAVLYHRVHMRRKRYL